MAYAKYTQPYISENKAEQLKIKTEMAICCARFYQGRAFAVFVSHHLINILEVFILMKMKIVTLLIICCMLFLAACGGQTQTPADDTSAQSDNGSAERLNVIATIFPQYDFVRRIAGDRVELTMLLSPGAEAHSFEPTPQDIIRMQSADLFIYIGGHGERWVDTILAAILETHDMRVVSLLDLVGWLEAEHDHDHHHHGHSHSHGHGHSHDHHDDCDDHDCDDDSHNHSHSHSHSHDHHHDHDDCDDNDCDDDSHNHSHSHSHSHSHEHHHDNEDCDDDDCDDDSHDHSHGRSHGHSHDHHHHHHHHDDAELDEHVWTSPRNVIQIVLALTDVLSQLDPENAYYFRANAAEFIMELHELDAAITEVVEQGVRRTIVFGDRFPFRYLAHTYGLTYYAAFVGCSIETQASPARIARLIETVRNEEIPIIFYIEFSNRQIANVIAEETGARILELHSAHNLSHADFNAGVTYLEIMWRNVERLREALS